MRVVEIYNNQLYATSAASTGYGIFSIGSGLPTTAGNASTLLFNSSISGSASPYGFVMFSTGSQGAGVLDLAYIADDRTTLGGGLQKWTLSGTSWSNSWSVFVSGTVGSPPKTLQSGTGVGFAGLRGLAGTYDSVLGATLYATTTELSNNRLISILDSGSTQPSTYTTLQSAGSNQVFRGVVYVTGAAAPAAPSVNSWPTASAITYGQTLASSNLSGGSASAAGNFTFTSPSTAPAVGTALQAVTFTPADTTNYTTVSGNVSVTVNKLTPEVTVWPTASAIDYGQTLASSTLNGGSASVAGNFTFTSPSTAPAVGTALQAVTFTPADTTNHTTVSGNVSVTVNKLTPEVTTWPAATVIALGQTLASSTLSGGSASVAGNFTFTNSSTAPAIGTASQAVTFTPTDSATYNSVSGNASVTVKKALLFSGYALTTVNKVVSISPSKILARASDPNGGTLALTQVFGPSAQGGTVSLTSTVNYTPGTSFTGTDSFQVELTSSTGVKLRGTITVTVTDSAISQNLSQLTPHDGIVDLVFRGIPGRSYTIQRSSNLLTWTNLATIQAAADGKISYTDTAPLQPNGYYRTAN